MNAAAASHADDAASWARGCDGDGVSCVCDCDRDPWRAHGAVRACYTHCSTDCCETLARCRPGPGRSPKGTCYFSGEAPDRRMTCSHLEIGNGHFVNCIDKIEDVLRNLLTQYAV